MRGGEIIMAAQAIQRKYYNEDIKKRYLEEKKQNGFNKSQIEYLERIFTTMSKYEEELDKDTCCFTSQEIDSMLKRCDFVSTYMAANYIAQFNRYTQWCVNQNLVFDFQNHYLEIENPAKYVNNIKAKRRIISRNELLSAISTLSNAGDQFAILALFEGLGGQNRCELRNLRASDIDTDTNTMSLCTGRDIKVSDKLIDIALEASQEMVYTSLSERTLTFSKDEPEDLVFKNFGNTQETATELMKGRRVYFRIVKKLASIGLEDLSIPSIVDSGKIHMIHEIAKGHGITAMGVVNNPELIALVEKQFNVDMKTRKTAFISNYKEYLQ